MKKSNIFAIILVAIFAFMTLASCTKNSLLIDTETLKVERDGATTTFYDLVGDKEYSFRTNKLHKDEISDEMKTDRVAVDTDTIKITVLYGGGFIVEDKTANAVYHIEKGGANLVETSAIETTS